MRNIEHIIISHMPKKTQEDITRISSYEMIYRVYEKLIVRSYRIEFEIICSNL